MNDRRVRFSIVVPVYKVEQFLDRCVESLVAQSYKDIEIILVDDGSPDRCPEMCDEWASRDDRIVVLHKENGGLSSARNCGIRVAKGDYLLLVDSDDYIQPDACERFVACVGNEDIDLIIGNATIFENDTWNPRRHTNLQEGRIYSGPEYAMTAISANEWFAACCYNMYRRAFLLENNLFYKEGILHEDIEYMPRLCLAAKKVKYLGYEWYKYIIREESISGHLGNKQLSDLWDTYSEWADLNESIEDKDLKYCYKAALSKYFMYTCRVYGISDRTYPKGLSGAYVLHNHLNMREFVKALLFVCARKVYVRL